MVVLAMYAFVYVAYCVQCIYHGAGSPSGFWEVNAGTSPPIWRVKNSKKIVF